MVSNFSIPKPGVNPLVANMGYLFGACTGVGVLLFMILPLTGGTINDDGSFNMTGMILPLILILFGALGPWGRYLIFGKNPDGARPLPQPEMDEINQQMHGKWQAEYNAQQGGLNNCMNRVQAQENDVANGNYTFTSYGKEGRTRRNVRKLMFHRTGDGRLYFDNYGAQVYILELPQKFVAVNFLGQDITWQRMSGGAQLENLNPVPTYSAGAPPGYSSAAPANNPSAPPSYNAGSTSSSGKTIAEQIEDLNNLRRQGVLTQSEFETAKTKVLA